MAANKGRTIRKVSHQTGRTSVRVDVHKQALKPGMRISRNNKRYFENRKNRSDLRKRL